MKAAHALILVLASLVGVVGACGSEETDRNVDIPQASKHYAWIGEADDGFRVLLEAVAPPQDESNARFSEEYMLRNRLPLDPDAALMRLHLFGSAATLQAQGEVEVGGQRLKSFGDAPTDLDIGQRLLWNSVLRGLPAPDPAMQVPLHRSIILQADAQTLEQPAKEAVWSGQQRQIPLQLRSWTEMDRGRFFDESLTPPKEENG